MGFNSGFKGLILRKIPKAEGNLFELSENAYKVFIIQKKFRCSIQFISTEIQAKNWHILLYSPAERQYVF